MRKLLYSALALLFISCDFDNYEGPTETFKGTIIDRVTGEGFQTEVGDNGVQFKMLETSYKENPNPWYFTVNQDGAFQNTKVFSATYNVTPLGAFVPFVQTDDNGNTTADESVNLEITGGTTTYDFTVEPFLVVSWVGEPVANDGKITVQAKVERGTENPDFQQECTDITLFINSSSYYVGNNNYDSKYIVSVDNPDEVIGQTITLTTPELPYNNATYYIRVGARIDYNVNGVKRYNYNEPLAVKVE